jgi:hypothetical protein
MLLMNRIVAERWPWSLKSCRGRCYLLPSRLKLTWSIVGLRLAAQLLSSLARDGWKVRVVSSDKRSETNYLLFKVTLVSSNSGMVPLETSSGIWQKSVKTAHGAIIDYRYSRTTAEQVRYQIITYIRSHRYYYAYSYDLTVCGTSTFQSYRR